MPELLVDNEATASVECALNRIDGDGLVACQVRWETFLDHIAIEWVALHLDAFEFGQSPCPAWLALRVDQSAAPGPISSPLRCLTGANSVARLAARYDHSRNPSLCSSASWADTPKATTRRYFVLTVGDSQEYAL